MYRGHKSFAASIHLFSTVNAPADDDAAAPQVLTSFQANSAMATVTTATVAPARCRSQLASTTDKCRPLDIFPSGSHIVDLQFVTTVKNYEN